MIKTTKTTIYRSKKKTTKTITRAYGAGFLNQKSKAVKKQVKNSGPFKIISRKLQKRKDGKRVYYYVNKTDGGISNKESYLRNEELKKKYKGVYGKNWRVAYKEAVTDVKKIEKKQKSSDSKKELDIIKEEIERNGFPVQLAGFLNTSISKALVNRVIAGKPTVLSLDGHIYLLDDNNLADFEMFVSEILDWFFEQVKLLYSKELKRKKSKASPFLIWDQSQFSRNPTIIGSDLNNTTASEDFALSFGKSKAQKQKSLIVHIRSQFKNYFSGMKEIDLPKYILKFRKNEKGTK